MNPNLNEFTLLSYEQVWGDQKMKFLITRKCALTDFAILLGAYVSDRYHVFYDGSLKGRTGLWYLSSFKDGNARRINEDGLPDYVRADARNEGIRPVFSYAGIPNINVLEDKNGLLAAEYGEYPQYAPDIDLFNILDNKFSEGKLRKTGKTYTTDSRRWNAFSERFISIKHEEFEYNDKKYVRVKSNCWNKGILLSNGFIVKPSDYVWVEVSPIVWYVDEKLKMLVSKKIIASGVRFCDREKYNGDFKNTEVYMFLNKYFAQDIIANNVYETVLEEQYESIFREKEEIDLNPKLENPYNFKFEKVSEEDIIRGAVESGVAVFLHGPSSEGKSARVKQIDPECEIIYLRNATPDSLNGKSVYNSQTGEMIDVKPSWLKKIEEKCEKEPDRFHIVFFDEITNALPSIQGIAFNIVLDREVNGIWKLPDNARIVAAGNDMNDSLAANRLAEPLFNRFAHVYIRTTTESWLRWASENNIHPAIYSYIAYTKGRILRSEYDGERPNADPRKWEMASKMLYKTGNPEMLRALVGEDITREFVQFCKQKVITLDDVINERYNYRYLQRLNTAERYATIIGLSQASENNLEVVRNFVKEFGAEFETIFDALWVHGDEERLEKLAEVKLSEKAKVIKR